MEGKLWKLGAIECTCSWIAPLSWTRANWTWGFVRDASRCWFDPAPVEYWQSVTCSGFINCDVSVLHTQSVREVSRTYLLCVLCVYQRTSSSSNFNPIGELLEHSYTHSSWSGLVVRLLNLLILTLVRTHTHTCVTHKRELWRGLKGIN